MRVSLILLSCFALLGAGAFWFGMPYGAKGLHRVELGQTRAEAEKALGAAAFFGRTCFGELAVFTDLEEDGADRHIMAVLDEQTQRVKAREVQIEPATVSGSQQCSRMVVATAQTSFSSINWADRKPGFYSAGVSQRHFLRRVTGQSTSMEVWGDYKEDGNGKTCEIFVREAVAGEERLAGSGEWTLPGVQNAIAFDLSRGVEVTQGPGS